MAPEPSSGDARRELYPGGLFRVVLHQPEIPNNTGNIGRTCVATGCELHLIRPLGFDTGEKACRRAGLDYWPRLGVREHDSWDRFVEDERPARLWLLSTKPGRSIYAADFEPSDVLVFGKETAGLPREMLERYRDRVLTMPMVPGERSLNLATAVCAVVYEGVRQQLAAGRLELDTELRLVLSTRGAKS